MKKILMLASVAACVIQAQAQLNYEMSTSYDGAKFDVSQSYYKAYTATATWVQNLTGAATVDSLMNYFTKAAWNENYDTVVSAIKNTADSQRLDRAHPYYVASHDNGTWLQAWYDSSTTTTGNQFIMYFYDDGEEQGYRVAMLNSTSFSGTTSWEGDKTATWSDWKTVEIPEPTSGLLMLLGVAGLALKRRRV